MSTHGRTNEELEAWRKGFNDEESGAIKNNPYPQSSTLWHQYKKGWEADQ